MATCSDLCLSQMPDSETRLSASERLYCAIDLLKKDLQDELRRFQLANPHLERLIDGAPLKGEITALNSHLQRTRGLDFPAFEIL